MTASRLGVVERSLTFSELLRQATDLAAALQERNGRGERALLVFRPGTHFIVGFVGCLLAGVIAVPIPPPRNATQRDATDAIAANAMPRFVLVDTDFLPRVRRIVEGRPAWQGREWIAIDSQASIRCAFSPRPIDLAFLQYTSGSTSVPRGAAVTHANLSSNLEMMQGAFGTWSGSVFCCWLPLFHDMGLIGNALHAIHAGSCCILMAPTDFMMRPQSWLKLISEHKVDFAGAPNFAYDHCVDRYRPDERSPLDLSSWRIAFNGAEPVKAATLDRFAAAFGSVGFAPKSFFPCYGMAEATVMVSGKKGWDDLPARREHEGGTLIGCGRTLPGEQLAIVHPTERLRQPAGTVGEIWLRGPNVVAGYWGLGETNRETFDMTIRGEPEGWLRTGDLGLVDEQGELFITGRLKELIIVRGHNHYPHDIEATVRACHPAFRNQLGAAFVLESSTEPRLIVLQEVDRGWKADLPRAELETSIREAVTTDHGLSVDRVALLPAGAIPRTTSGKVRRLRARDMWLAGDYRNEHGRAG